MVYISSAATPVGRILLAQAGEGLVGAWLEGQRYYMAGFDPNEAKNSETPLLTQAKQWLDDYFAGKRPSPSALPLAPRGTPFRQAVWQLLCQIPYGQTVTYGQLARQMAAVRGGACPSARAVGSAVGHNPLSVIIPCHRVVGTDGCLTGYAGGLDTKARLLLHEGVRLSSDGRILSTNADPE